MFSKISSFFYSDKRGRGRRPWIFRLVSDGQLRVGRRLQRSFRTLPRGLWRRQAATNPLPVWTGVRRDDFDLQVSSEQRESVPSLSGDGGFRVFYGLLRIQLRSERSTKIKAEFEDERLGLNSGRAPVGTLSFRVCNNAGGERMTEHFKWSRRLLQAAVRAPLPVTISLTMRL